MTKTLRLTRTTRHFVDVVVKDGETLKQAAARVMAHAERIPWVPMSLAVDMNTARGAEQVAYRSLSVSDTTLPPYNPDVPGSGPISVTLDTGAPTETVLGRFATMAEAEAFLNAQADPAMLRAGLYSLNAPWGLATDAEAYAAALGQGYRIFRSMGALYYAAPGVSTDHRSNPGCTGWVRVDHDNTAAAAWIILDDIEP